MATRQADSLALVQRAQRIKWRVEKNEAGGFKIICPDGSLVPVHLTYSDVRSLKNTEAELNRRGFADAEQEFEQRRETERQAKLAADAKANERRTKAAANRAAAREKAAGPYGRALVTIDDILADHPAPMTFQRVLITPEMAKAILERNVPTPQAPWPNRPIYSVDVAVWEGVLRTGRWRYTHQGVALDWDGRLQDGQNRLTAIAETGIAAEMMVSVGMDPENFKVVDAGRKRTAAQVLRMSGLKDSAPVSSAVRLIHLYEVWGAALIDHANGRVTSDVIADVAAKLDQDDLSWSVRWGYSLRRETVATAVSAPIAAMYLIRRRLPAGDPRVEQFASLLVDGVVGEGRQDSPVYQLRRQLSRLSSRVGRRMTPAEQLALIIKGWNAFAQGRTGGAMLVVRKDSATPMVFLPPPIEDNDTLEEE